MNDPLGDRMKAYESAEADRRLMPLLPALGRVDGRAFHSFTKGMARPFDSNFQAAMIETAVALMEETNANVGYTQSDEITLAWYPAIGSEIWFGGRIAKMVSQLAAHTTLHFYRACECWLPDFTDRRPLPTFDARVWNVPTLEEAANVFVWREQDATKNSITMAAQNYYTHKELHGKSSEQKQEMLFQKGVNWNDYPNHFKRGVYVQRRTEVHRFTTDEIDKLPPRHQARSNPNLTVQRSSFATLAISPITKIINREAVLFHGALPVVVP